MVLVFLVALALVGVGHLRRAAAFPPFLKEFGEKYMQKESPLYKAYEGKATCNVCHVGGTTDRHHRNAYGQALDKELNKSDADALGFAERRRNPLAAKAAQEKVRQALNRVEGLPSDPMRQSSPSFGELIRTGRLPVSPSLLPD
jgi:hypothetical protein